MITMELKYKCRFCGTISIHKLCHNCSVKYKILKKSGMFSGKAKKAPYKTRWERTNAYTHELGSGTKELIDFVNKSGTIHYGRYVAQHRKDVK